MPEAGEEFLGFRLVSELGRGAFARVFLASQGELADRPVVLKIASRLERETGTLARLQHTHVVPIYSVHRSAGLQAFCMPYLGPTTLADLLRDIAGREELPGSGKDLLSSLEARSREGPASSSAPGVAPSTGPAAPPAATARPRPASDAARVTRRMLEGMTYVESALWIVSCLADGLSHAHERGILHRDLKPANVLITDEGQPLLLDFNLSQDLGRAEGPGAAAVGGTLPYMGPEHLDAFRGGARQPDARGDVYSLGVILYELLTGRRPFRSPAGPTLADAIARMIDERLRPPPDPRRRNAAVSPAVASILRHCLEPDPERRYQSADELREDLRRQLEHRPLRHAADPSPRERVRKWARRNPRLASTSTLGVVLLTIVLSLAGGLGLGLYWAGERDRAREALARFERGLHEALSALYSSVGDEARRGEGMSACRRALDLYPTGAGERWRDAPLARHLDPPELARLSEGRGEALWLLAQATWLQATGRRDARRIGDELRQAYAWNLEAEACYPAESVPIAILTQRAALLRGLGRADEALRYSEMAAARPARTPRDHYLAAAEQALLGRYESAMALLGTATKLAPRSSWAWFLRGVCHDRLGEDVDALACYQAGIALRPDDPWGYFHRGLLHLRRREPGRALADFDEALRLEPGRVRPLLERALAPHDLGRQAGSSATQVPSRTSGEPPGGEPGPSREAVEFGRLIRAAPGPAPGAPRAGEAG